MLVGSEGEEGEPYGQQVVHPVEEEEEEWEPRAVVREEELMIQARVEH